MSNYLTTDTELTSVANAIRTKGGTSDNLTYPAGFVSAIEAIPSGGGSSTVEAKDVNFYDDLANSGEGGIVASYTASEFAELSALPSNPEHTGMTAQGWNWTLADAKTYVSAYGRLDIGQMYTTSDGKTRLYLHFENNTRSAVTLYWNQTVSNGVTIDWGDGSATETKSGSGLYVTLNATHTYANSGDYVLTLNVTSGKMYLGYGNSSYSVIGESSNNGRVYLSALKAVEIGNNVQQISGYAFNYCQSLSRATISSGVTTIGEGIFQSCYSLGRITIPSGITTVNQYTFKYCYSLKSISLPNTVEIIDHYIFQQCNSLKGCTIPSSVTDLGNYVFDSCTAMEYATLPSSFGSSIGTYVFQNCNSLTDITIPSNIDEIGIYSFYNCYSLSKITIPASMSDLKNYSFGNCYGAKEYHMLPSSPPTMNYNALSNLPDDCVIYVPYSADHSILNTYKAASGWSIWASNIQEEPSS